MHTYRVDDMTCGHCARAITEAVRSQDAAATVEFDMSRHLVRINHTTADAAKLAAAIADAGYTPVAVEDKATPPAAAKAGGCCCGGARRSCA